MLLESNPMRPHMIQVPRGNDMPRPREAALTTALNESIKAMKGDVKEERKKEPVLSTKDIEVGDKLVIPKDVDIKDIIEVLNRRKDEEDGNVQIVEMIDAFPLDAARALKLALEELFPSFYREGKKVMTFMGEIDIPPQMRSIETGHNKTELIHWGRFCVPGSEGNIETKFSIKNNRQVLSIVANVQQKEEYLVRSIAEKTREILKTNSVYKGKAFSVVFETIMQDDQKIDICTPSFFDITAADRTEIIYNKNTQDAIEMNLFTLLRRTNMCREHMVPLKRGILLYGTYGVGKSLAALHTAKLAQDNGWTYIYVKNPWDIPNAIGFAQQYQPAVLFCEDIDKAVSGARGISMDKILNSLDGIDSKSTEIITIMTTNVVKELDPAMMRPGRIDAAIEIPAPDRFTVNRLIQLYGRGYLRKDADFSGVCELFEDQIPAVIGEAVEKAKLYAIGRSTTGSIEVSPAELEIAFATMKVQRSLLEEERSEYMSEGEKSAKILVEGLNKILKDIFRKGD